VWSMVGWTGSNNFHITYLPNKPTDRGVCMKKLCDARVRVIINLEFGEARRSTSRTATRTRVMLLLCACG
jgi:hypothetical protein